MKFGLAFASSAGTDAESALEICRRAELGGFDSVWGGEHVIRPDQISSPYPYAEDGVMPGEAETPIPDPLIWLAYVAAVAPSLRLGTCILILPQRNPLVLAKELATLDVLSGGRALLGVGIGWLREEFETLDVPFPERAARTEESIRAIRSLWTKGAEPFAGEFFRWGPVHSYPKPVQPGGVPILVGGHVEGAARRAARLGDGFFPAEGDPQKLARLLGALRDECGKIGRDPAEIEITTGAAIQGPDDVRRYEDLGISRLVTGPPGFDKDGVRKGLESFGDRILSKL